MASLSIPPNLARDIAASGNEQRRAWLADLQATITALSDRWSLSVGEPYLPGGCCAWVAPAWAEPAHDRLGGPGSDGRAPAGDLGSATAAGDAGSATAVGDAGSATAEGDARSAAAHGELVLKVSWSHDESLHEPDALLAWDGAGAVRLVAENHHEYTTAMLLERCVPGTTLAASMAEPDQDLIVAGLLRRLWIEPAPGHPFRPLEVMCDAWADEFGAALEGRPDAIDPGLAREGVAVFRELARTATSSVLLTTDLHAENILAAEREPWLVIDPKPYVGDPAYDVLQHMLNCPGRLHADPRGLSGRMAELCELDAERVTAWLFARAVVESVEDPTLAALARQLAAGARS